MRKEKDALGEVLVPPDKYYGAQTQRACENFKVGTERFYRDIIQAHALVKRCAAVVNCQMGQLGQQLSEAIVQAADEVIAGKFDDHFPLVIWQSGSGTQFNMNVNEVIGNRAIELLGGEIGTKNPVHPNDHVNMSQSTNDTMPTSMHIAAVTALKEKLLPNLAILIGVLEHKAREFKEIMKIGRTHLQDATPLSLGQEFWGYAAQLEIGMEALERALEHLYELPIGATAVGTGINSPAGFDEKMVQEISTRSGYTFKTARSKFAALAGHEAVVNASGAMKTIAVALMKIANDLRWLSSGPRCGLGELTLPTNEPGSSIMPGKVNPTQCEMITMVACQVIGNDAAVTMAGSQGNFELNVYKPLLANSLLQSINLLADAVKSFNEKCVTGIKPNLKKIAEHLNNSLMLVTALNKHIGYDKAAEIALKAWQEEMTLKQAALESGYLSEEQFDLWVRPEEMTQPDKTS